jgi:hypothetical protein
MATPNQEKNAKNAKICKKNFLADFGLYQRGVFRCDLPLLI